MDTHLVDNFYFMACMVTLIGVTALALVLFLGNEIYNAIFPEKKDEE